MVFRFLYRSMTLLPPLPIANRAELQGQHTYHTLYEYLESRQQATAFEPVGWRLELFRLHTSRRPIAVLDPSLVQIEILKDAAVCLWKVQGTGGRRRPKPKANDWAALLDDVDDDEVDEEMSEVDEEMGDADSCSSASEDRVHASDASDVADHDDGDGISSGASDLADEGGDRPSPPPPPPPFALPDLLDAAAVPAVAAAVEVDAAPEAAIVAVEAAEPVRIDREVAELRIDVPGGYLKYHRKTQQIVAHCQRHGDRMCRLTRTVKGAGGRARAGQGRPLGLLCAWLQAGDKAELDSSEEHKQFSTISPISVEERMIARAEFTALPGHEQWLAIERPPRDEEDLEPEAIS